MRVEYAGREISVEAVRPLLDFLAGYHEHASRVQKVAGGDRIAWDDLRQLLDAAATLTADLRPIGAQGVASALYKFRRRARFGRALLTLGDSLRFFLHPRNPIDFACLNAAVRVEPGRVDVVAYINDGYRPNTAFFELMHGAAEELMRQFDLPQGAVALNLQGRQAHYVFTYAHSDSLRARLHRWLSRFVYSTFSLLVIRSAYPYLVQGRKMFEQQLIERAKLEEQLIESERAFDRRLDNIDDVIGELDADGSLVYVSPNLGRLAGGTIEEMLTSPLRLVHPEDLAALQESFVRARHDPAGGRVDDFRVFDAAGNTRWVELTLRPFFTPSGAKHTICVARDVSDRRRYRARQEELGRQLERSQRLEMLGVLAGGIAHDFNNLLQPILAEADLALRELEDRPQASARIGAVKAAAEKATDLVRQLMVYSGTEAGSLSTVDLAGEARGLQGLIRTSLPPGVELRVYFDDDARVRGDLSFLRQVILNLVINAVEAIGDGEGAIDLAVRRLNDKVTLTVLDDGCGMDEATREQAFEPFFSTKFAGRGLGLSAVIGAVRAHSGELTIDSEPGRGTLVTVSLDAEIEGDSTASEPRRDEQRSTGTVLLVDDDEGVRAIGKSMLEAADYEVELACDGKEALEKFEHGTYAAIVLDLVMPRVDGRQVLSAVRRRLPQLPVVVVSGYGAQLVSAELTADPYTRFLSKPFRSRDLIGALQDLAGTTTQL